jgi:D-alanyl-D-alanine carboxypeptidase/D-alanyl-D-alanine-endopeptidase (penicillin-binding protein 4)
MKKLCLYLFLLLFLPTLSMASHPMHQTLSQQINAVLKNYDNNVSIAILLKDQKTGKTLFQKNPDHLYMPASNQKIPTAYAALEYLGEDYTYQTKLFADTDKIQNGILKDNIYLRFTGDPTLTLAQLNNLIHALQVAGVHQITGDVIVDDTAFDQMTMSPGSTWDDKDFCWGAPVNSITIDKNCVNAILTPASEVNQVATLTLPDFPQSLQFINKAVTVDHPEEKCLLEIQRGDGLVYTINGCISSATKTTPVSMAIDNPRNNLEFLLAYLFNKNQISFNPHFKFEKITQPPTLLATEKSAPLSELVKTMMKDSDNIIANSVFKTIGAAYAKEPGSFKNGSEAVRKVIHDTAHIDIPDTTVIDGSGASRYNFLSPQQLVTLLEKSYTSKHAKTFIASLPIAGIDGTLIDRMKDPVTQGQVFAKTGTMTAASTLSGYLQNHKKQTLVFSIMINGFVDMPTRYRELEDQLCKVMIQAS